VERGELGSARWRVLGEMLRDVRPLRTEHADGEVNRTARAALDHRKTISGQELSSTGPIAWNIIESNIQLYGSAKLTPPTSVDM
jgi:hypothetical protein